MSWERDKNNFRFCRGNKITKRFTLSDLSYFFDSEESEVIFILRLREAIVELEILNPLINSLSNH